MGTLVAEWNTGGVLAYIRFLTKQQPPFLAAVGNSRTYFSLYKQVALVSNHYMGKSFSKTAHDSVNVSNTLFWFQS